MSEDFPTFAEVGEENIRQRTVQPVIDAGLCTSCHAVRVCSAIVPHGSWNPYQKGANGKRCGGVL